MCSRDLWTFCLLSRPFLFGRRGLPGAELRQQLAEGFSFLSRYDDIYSCLDNDAAGNNTVMAMREKYGSRVHDLSQEYAGYKDLNEYLCRKR